jgi:hypothetical protein
MVPPKLTFVLQALASPSGILCILIDFSPEPLKSGMDVYLPHGFLFAKKQIIEDKAKSFPKDSYSWMLRIVQSLCLTVLNRNLKKIY